MTLRSTTTELNTYRILILCSLVILLEGFDIQAAGVSAPIITEFFALSATQKGWFLGASAVGIFISAALGGILADKFGRKPVVVIGVTLFGLFSLSTLLSTNIEMLILTRFLTGLGLGAAMPIVIAYASDHSPEEMKKRAVGFIYCTIPIGGLLSGIVIQLNLFSAQWKSVYLVGGIAPIIVAPILLFLLPESISKSEKSSSSRLNIVSGLFSNKNYSITLFLWVGTFGTLLVMYLLLGWMPSLLEAMGLTKSQAQNVQIVYNLGAAVGAFLGGYLLDKKFLYSTISIAYIGLAILLAIFGFGNFEFFTALIVALGIGGTVTIAQASIYAFAPLCYSSEIRNTGVGSTVAAGRLGTITGPLLAGSLLGAGQSASNVLIVLIPITLVSGVMTMFVIKILNSR